MSHCTQSMEFRPAAVGGCMEPLGDYLPRWPFSLKKGAGCPLEAGQRPDIQESSRDTSASSAGTWWLRSHPDESAIHHFCPGRCQPHPAGVNAGTARWVGTSRALADGETWAGCGTHPHCPARYIGQGGLAWHPPGSSGQHHEASGLLLAPPGHGHIHG